MLRSVPICVICLVGSLYLTSAPAPAETGSLNHPTTLHAKPAVTAIRIDGRIEDAWLEAARFDNFAEFMPSHRVAAKVPTEGYVTHTETDLYVAFVCHDPEIDKLRASLTDHDRIYRDDFVGIVLDTYQDQQRAYEFFSNPHGIQGDMLWYANRSEDDGGAIWQSHGGEDESYDAVWESAGRIYDGRWVVEMKIPLSSLRYPDQSDQHWGVHFVRVYPRENRYEFSWMPISQDNNSFMGQAGGLNLALPQAGGNGRSLELMPYLSSSRTDKLVGDETGNGAWRNQNRGILNASKRMGFTGKYSLSSTTSLDFAYKPDFSQIESDAGHIDVNAPFAFFYQERRPFFMEGSDVFQVDTPASGMILDVANLIYTRSINDPILAGKVTGKSGRLTYGYISAYDDDTPLILPLADGTIVRQTTRNSWSNIFRGQVEVADQSHIGFAATNRRFAQGGYNTAVLAESSLRLSDNYTWTALGAATHTDEPNDAGLSDIIPDQSFDVGGKSITADFDGQHFGGYVLKTTLIRQSRAWNYNLSYQDFSPGFRADNSAIFSNDGRILHTQHTYSIHFDEHPILNFLRPGLYVWRKTDHDGNVKDLGMRPGLRVSFQHQTDLNIGGFLFNQERFHDVDFDDARSLWIYLGTNAFEKVSGGVYLNRGKSINRFGESGSAHNPLELVPTLDARADLTVRPTEKLGTELSYDSTRLLTDAGRDLIVRQRILRSSLQYQFSRQLFVRFIGELTLTRRATAVDLYEESKLFSFEPLVSYKLNPFTVFYLGGNLGGTEDPYDNRRGLARTDQTLFLKFQYLL